MAEVDQGMVDAFNEALNKNQQDRKTREDQRKGGGGGSGGFEVVEWCGLEDQVEKVVRIISKPIEIRTVGTDAKLIYHSKLLNDKKDGYVNVVWETKEDGTLDEDWILYDLYSKVFKKEWSKYADGHKNDKGHDGEYAYANAETETYKRMNINLKKDASPKFFPPKTKPKARVYMNVIDRHDAWCKENNHTKILTSKNSYWKDDADGNPITFPDPGVPEMVYSNIMDQVVAYRHHWNLDVVIKKNSKDINNAYIVKDILEEKLLDETKALGNAEALTEEEKAYEMFDFDKLRMTTRTPYYAIYNRLVGLFKMFDAEFNENLTGKLEKLLAEEKEILEQKRNEEIDQEFKEEKPVEQKQESSEPSVEQEPVKQEARRAPQESEVVKSSIEYNEIFPSWDKMKDIEKEEMKKNIVSMAGNVPTYQNPSDAFPCIKAGCVFADSTIQTSYPSTVRTCPVCGEVDNS